MARSKSFFDDIKKELECSVCQEQFSEANEPKILKCLHTFCENCLEAWLRKHRNGKLSCPTCRHITNCPNDDINKLPSNLFCKQLVEIVEAYSGQGPDESPQCGNCDQRMPLKFYCSNCNFFLCGDCAELHNKFKSFRGHEIKEIGNFESGDLQDYSRKANICKHHQDENRFFCVKCGICICRDCVVLEHHDHKKISLQQGIENNKSEIEAKMCEVRATRSWLITFRKASEERKLKQGSDIEEARNEAKRVAERSISLIRQHEASVNEKLLKRNEALHYAFSALANILDGKVTEIDNTLAFCEEVLQRNNLPEILNVKTMIEERLQELLLTMDHDNLPKLDSSRVKYVPSDFEFPTYAPGKLLVSNTDPLKSVARGRGLTEGRVGDVCTFTVTTKDSTGKKTYSELDEVRVAIKFESQQLNENVEPTNSQDGRYSVSYKPTTHGECAVSISINDIAINGSPFILEVKEKLEDGGGDFFLDGDGAEYPRDVPSSVDRLVIYRGRVKLSVYKGDITKEPVDVIVKASDRFLSLAGGVGKAIVSKGGKRIEDDSREIRRKRGSLKDGDAVATESGNLPCKVVVHVVHAEKKRKILRRACINSLLEAQKLSMTSIALPVIGPGNCEMPKDICAKVMCDAVDEFIRRENAQTKTITDIRFVDTDEPSVLAFRKELKRRFGDDSMTHASEGGSATSLPSRVEGDSSKPGFEKSDRGRNRKPNNFRSGETHSPTEQQQSSYSPDGYKSVFGRVHSHPLSSPSQTLLLGDSYSNSLNRNVAGIYGSPPRIQQPAAYSSSNALAINAPVNDSNQPITPNFPGPTSSSRVHSHPLSSPGQTSPLGDSYSNSLPRNTADIYASPPTARQPAPSGGKRLTREKVWISRS
ncbi:E3 ubiquitin-protein ligase TRIM71-like isoform X2 [Montipora capricornis]|uniref:E3 ubiquitin-protein ligase TRIM71-like isoform X2 n=1 Tax=Montipora capricornis TaxID=246305 RepID=UPI0035F168FA